MKIEHVAIWTRDLERLRAFYETYFNASAGLKYTNPNKGFESYFLSFETGARMEIMCMASIPETRDDPVAQATGLTHIAFSIGSVEEVDALTTRLAEHGYSVVSQPRRTGDGYYESVVLDPDGNRLEIAV